MAGGDKHGGKKDVPPEGKVNGPQGQAGNTPTDGAAEQTPSYAETVGVVPIGAPLEGMDGKLAAALTKLWAQEKKAQQSGKAKRKASATVSQNLVMSLVQRMNGAWKSKVVAGDQEIAEIGLIECCEGDLLVGFGMSPLDHPICSAVANHDELVMTSKHLVDQVKGLAFLEWVRTETKADASMDLTKAVEIARVKDNTMKIWLAQFVLDKNPSVRQLRKEIVKLSAKASASGVSDTIRKGIADRKKALTDKDLQGLIKDKAVLESLNEKERRDIRSDLEQHRVATEEYLSMIEELDNRLWDIEAEARAAKAGQRTAGAAV